MRRLFNLNRVRVSIPQRFTYTQILVESRRDPIKITCQMGDKIEKMLKGFGGLPPKAIRQNIKAKGNEALRIVD